MQTVCRVLQHGGQGQNVSSVCVWGGRTPSPHRRVLHGRPPALSTDGETTTVHFLYVAFSPRPSPRLVGQFLCVQQEDRLNADEPHISKEMYDVAIGLIQSFDEMEGEESRCAYWITLRAFFAFIFLWHNCLWLFFAAGPKKETACLFQSEAVSSSSFLGYTKSASCRRLWPSLFTRGECVSLQAVYSQPIGCN